MELEKLQAIRGMLRRQGEASLKLADDLKSYGGIPLRKDEKLLIRAAYMPIVNDMTEMLRINFLADNPENMDSAWEEINKISDELSNL